MAAEKVAPVVRARRGHARRRHAPAVFEYGDVFEGLGELGGVTVWPRAPHRLGEHDDGGRT